MICSKQYNLETNALITSKLGTQYWIVKWRRFRLVFLQKLSGCCNIAQSYYLLQVTLFCSKLKIFVKEIFLNQFRMPNKPCIPSVEVIIAIFLNLYDLLQKYYFTAFCIKPSFFERKTILNQFRMPNQPCISSLEVIVAILWKLYHLLQMILTA